MQVFINKVFSQTQIRRISRLSSWHSLACPILFGEGSLFTLYGVPTMPSPVIVPFVDTDVSFMTSVPLVMSLFSEVFVCICTVIFVYSFIDY